LNVRDPVIGSACPRIGFANDQAYGEVAERASRLAASLRDRLLLQPEHVGLKSTLATYDK
jgi:hypothetical protein